MAAASTATSTQPPSARPMARPGPASLVATESLVAPTPTPGGGAGDCGSSGGSGGSCGGAGGGCGGYGGWPITKPGEAAAVFPNAASPTEQPTDGRQAGGKGDRRQGGGAVEGGVADGGEAVRQGDREQGVAVPEGAIVDGGEALGQDEVGVPNAVVEVPVALLLAERRRQRDVYLSEEGVVKGLASDGGEALGKGDRRQGGGAVEGPAADGDETLRKGGRRQGVGAGECPGAGRGPALGGP
eukprot:scaffold94488_cov75-Phaeocystis_antarctica.AAC.1